VNLVTTAEEMPVNETISMHRQLCDDLRMPTGILFVNRMHRNDFPDEAIDQMEQRAQQTRTRWEKTALQEVAARAREEAGWSRLNARYLDRLARSVNMPIVEIPAIMTEEFGLTELKQVASCIGAQPRDAKAREQA
jgi:hypothetical protein